MFCFRLPGGAWEQIRDPWDLRAHERAALRPYTPSHLPFLDIQDLDIVVDVDVPPVVDLTDEESGVNVGASGSGVGRGGGSDRGGSGGSGGRGGHGGGEGRGQGGGHGPGPEGGQGGASAV